MIVEAVMDSDTRVPSTDAPPGAANAIGSWVMAPDGCSYWWDGASYTRRARPSGDGWTYEELRRWHNHFAGWALAIGIVNVFLTLSALGVVFGPIGILLGGIGLRRAEEHAPPYSNGNESGRRMAITAIVLGVIGLLMGLAWVAIFAADPDFEM